MDGLHDTAPQMEAFVAERIRATPVRDRLRLACELTDGARRLAAAGIRRRRPDVTEAEIRVELARQHYPAELVKAAIAAQSALQHPSQ